MRMSGGKHILHRIVWACQIAHGSSVNLPIRASTYCPSKMNPTHFAVDRMDMGYTRAHVYVNSCNCH